METIITAGKMSAATCEYAGRISISYVKRSSSALMFCLKKITSPVVRVVSSPYVYVKGKTQKSAQEMAQADEKIKRLEEKIATIEKKLSSLERSGVIVSAQKNLIQEKKTLTKAKSALLQFLVNDNLLLKDE